MQENSLDYRTILAMILMVIIYFYFFPAGNHQAPQVSNAVESELSVKSESTRSSETPVLKKVSSVDTTRRISLENSKVKVVVDGLGRIREVTYKNYESALHSGDAVVLNFSERPFNLDNISTAQGQIEWKADEVNNTAISFKGDQDGLKMERRLSLAPESYQLLDTIRLTNASSKRVESKAEIQLNYAVPKHNDQAGFFKKMFSPQREVYEFEYFHDGGVKRHALDNFKEVVHKEGALSWSGFSTKYFFSGFIPQNVSIQDLTIQRDGDFVVQKVKLSDRQVEPQGSIEYVSTYYVGPKEISELKKASPDLPKVINYGDWIGPISRLLLSILIFFHGLIPNYGLAIILLTILVKVVLFPLVFKSSVSMRRLQLVQPKMKAIQEKYKNDKARLQAEMMTLYKTEKVNPVGGCLPMLIQMPVFFALYRVFFASIELRHQAFFGWIHDLSAHDPYLILPICMTALMYLQQQITPTPPSMEDNEMVRAQKAMMKWLPVIFGMFMLFLPAGLTLYFLANAGISIGQQFWLNKHLNQKFPLISHQKTAS